MQANSQNPRLTLEEKFNLALLVAHYCSLTVLVLFRRRIGMRQISAGLLIVIVALFFMGDPTHEQAFDDTRASNDPFPYRTALPPDKPVRSGYLGLFAIVCLFAGARQRADRWREFKKGIPWHSYHRGISWLSFLPLQHSTIARFIEPALCVLLGFACWHWLSVALGLWLIFAGLALRFVEQWVYKQNLQDALAAIDGAIDGETLGETMQQVRRASPSAMSGSDRAIPTTLAADVEALIARRRRKK